MCLLQALLRPRTVTLFPYTTLFRSGPHDHNDQREVCPKIFRRTKSHRPPPGLRHGSGHEAQVERSEEHTSELQSQFQLVCRLLLEKKNDNTEAEWHTS